MASEEVAENNEIINGSLPLNAAIRFLNIYLGSPTKGSWQGHITQLYNSLKLPETKRGPEVRKLISFAILLPTTDRHLDVSVPENILAKCRYFRQLDERDWFADLQKIAKRDNEITEIRAKCISLGVIDPITYQPFTRQAFNWLMQHAEDSGDVTKENEAQVKKRMTNLVYAYGGAVICKVFETMGQNTKKVLNWKSGYFFERAIHDNFSVEQIVKIKEHELKKSSPKLVKKVNI